VFESQPVQCGRPFSAWVCDICSLPIFQHASHPEKLFGFGAFSSSVALFECQEFAAAKLALEQAVSLGYKGADIWLRRSQAEVNREGTHSVCVKTRFHEPTHSSLCLSSCYIAIISCSCKCCCRRASDVEGRSYPNRIEQRHYHSCSTCAFAISGHADNSPCHHGRACCCVCWCCCCTTGSTRIWSSA